MNKKIIGGLTFLAGIAAVAATQEPEIRRYLKIRAM
ncbi:MAG: DUF6893 family small protein [Thermoleophilaceae bacterium]|jgi:hypothetical protein